MKRSFLTLAAVALVASAGQLSAQVAQAPRGYQYFPRGKVSNQKSITANNLRKASQEKSVENGSAPAGAQPKLSTEAAKAPPEWRITHAGVYGYPGYGVMVNGYPRSLFGIVATPAVQGPGYITNVAYDNELAQAQTPAAGGPAMVVPPQGVYAAPSGGLPGAQSNGISSIYAYSGRFYGPYYGNGYQYYNYGGNCGWGSPYNSTYYNSGCYQSNACCRASRRLCTPFGGMRYGCNAGCYVTTPPTCPTVCEPCAGTVATPSTVIPPDAAPAGAPTPQPMPTTATEPVPQNPPKPGLTPEPQASNDTIRIFPRLGLARR